MTVKAIYVCGPMSASGRDDHNYPTFHAAADRLRGLGWDVLNPADIDAQHNTTGEHQSWDWYMRHAIRMVALADAIALLPGWGASRGAIIEYGIGTGLKIPTRTLNAWLEWKS